MRLEFPRQIFEKFSNVKFNGNQYSENWVLQCELGTGRLDKAYSRLSKFCELQRPWRYSTGHAPLFVQFWEQHVRSRSSNTTVHWWRMGSSNAFSFQFSSMLIHISPSYDKEIVERGVCYVTKLWPNGSRSSLTSLLCQMRGQLWAAKVFASALLNWVASTKPLLASGGLWRELAAADLLLGLRVRNPPVCMDVCRLWLLCVMWGTDIWNGLITRPEDSTACDVSECDLET